MNQNGFTILHQNRKSESNLIHSHTVPKFALCGAAAINRTRIPAAKENRRLRRFWGCVAVRCVQLTTVEYNPIHTNFQYYLVKDALLHHKAVGVAFNLSGYGDHAVNIWGAEFDEAGEINAIYMVDNNDGPPWKGEGMLYRKEVRYLPMNEQPTLYPYISNSAGTFTYRLIGLYTLSLGDDALWKQ